MITMKQRNFTTPEGYTDAHWAELSEGQEVYIKGTHKGKPKAYGPHKVHDIAKRELLNPRGQRFLQYQDDLIVKEQDDTDT